MSGHVVERLDEQKQRTAFVGLLTGLVAGGNHGQLAIAVKMAVKFAEFAVAVDQ